MTSEKVSIPAMSERSPRVPQLRRFAVPAVAAVGMLALASCAEDAPQDTWQPAGENAQTIPEQTHGNPLVEYTFIAIPAVLLAIIGGFTVNTMFELNRTNDTQCEVNVTGQQWWWE